MSAKKRSNVEHYVNEWLDHESDPDRFGKHRASGKKKRPMAQTSEPLDPAVTNASVIEVYRQLCKVRTDEGQKELLCRYRRAQVFLTPLMPGYRERSPVSVGDRAKVTVLGSTDGILEGVSKRRNQIARPAPGREGNWIHVIAANVDLVVVVTSVSQPEFSVGLVDRFLIGADVARIPVLICVNKWDIHKDSKEPWKIYQDLGREVHFTSAKTGLGIEGLLEQIAGKTVVFCGHSGVGKTSLLRLILNQEVGRVGEVSTITQKGKHTTTGAYLFPGPRESKLIDTPGVREFGLWGVTTHTLANYFPEMKDALEHHPEKASEFARFPSYERILESLKEDEMKRGTNEESSSDD